MSFTHEATDSNTMVKKKKSNKKIVNIDTLCISKHQHIELSAVKNYQNKMIDFCNSIRLNPVHVTGQSIIKYEEMYKEIYLLSDKYPEIWLIYDRLPKKIWRYNENVFNILYIVVVMIVLLLNMLFFHFLELGFTFKTLSYGDGGDAIYMLFVFIQIPVYFLLKRKFCGRIEKIINLLSDLNEILQDRRKIEGRR